ncbi:MAG: GTP-binding protein [Candidatus Altiarchaeales archaeon IMC4]|nr:MAG: GTP-binding protein [Candidatus Altiarchaeales archaeon IMC4]
MVAIDDRIKEIEDEIQNTHYNKATQHHVGKLKAKLAQLVEKSLKKVGGGGGGLGFGLKKTGHATAILVGFPSVGKSTLLNKLTNAESRVAAYEFTTLSVVPGMMDYEGAKIQILDLPGIICGAATGKGRGREVLSMTRNADLVLIIVDSLNLKQVDALLKELYNIGVRVNSAPPNVSITRTSKGGVNLLSTVKMTRTNLEDIRAILNIYGIHSADVSVNQDITQDQFIDVICKNRVYMPGVIAVNKMDMTRESPAEIRKKLGYDFIPISAEKGENLDKLRDAIFERLGMIKVYLKKRGQEADLNEPLIMKKGVTVGDVCDALHKDFRRKFKYGKLWGKSAKYDGQTVGVSHVLRDKDILMIVREN